MSLRFSAAWRGGSSEPFQARSNRSAETIQGAAKKVGSHWGAEFEAPLPFTHTPLTGRDIELSFLKDRWEQAQAGMGQVLLVVGSLFHQQVAEVMEARFKHLVETQAELLADHFAEAGIIEKAQNAVWSRSSNLVIARELVAPRFG